MKKIISFAVIFMLMSGCFAFADEPSEDACFQEITVGGEALPGFSSGSEKKDFSFGIEELPEELSGLPEISAVVSAGEYSVRTDYEPGGYVSVLTLKNGDYKDEVRIHIRKLQEITIDYSAIFGVSSGGFKRTEGAAAGWSYVHEKEYAYAEFDLGGIPASAEILKIEFGVNLTASATPLTVGFSNYPSEAALTSSNPTNLDHSGFEEIGIMPIELAGKNYYLPIDISGRTLEGNKLLLVAKKDSPTAYFNAPHLKIKYVQEVSLDKDIILGTPSAYYKSGEPVDFSAAPVKNSEVTVNVPVTASETLEGGKIYMALVCVYGDGKLYDVSFAGNMLLFPGDYFEETVDVTLPDTDEDVSISVLLWDDASTMLSLAQSVELKFE